MEDNNKDKTTVHIYNNSYTIVGEENSDHIRLVAALVDEKMREIQDSNRHLDTAKLAVLTAVNAMNDYVKLQEEHDTLLQLLNQEEDK